MIHILSAVSAGAEQSPLVAPQGEAASVSFLALFAQALKQAGVAGDQASVLSVLSGQKGQKSAASGDGQNAEAPPAGQVVAVDPVAGDPAAAVEASLMSMLGLPVPVPVPVTATVPTATTSVAADQPALVEAPGAEPPDALLVEVDGDPGGKKLPNPLAVIAGQQKMELIQAQPEVAKVELAKAVTLPPGLPQDAQSSLSVLPAVKETAAPAVTTTDTAATPVSGQEAALITARGHAAMASQSQGKVAIGMQSSFGTPAWQQELGDKMVWLAGRHGQMAELVLNPPSLGAVEVRLNMSGAEASAQFFSANPNVRDVIEAALPRLREMMVGAGISLGEAMVSNQSFGQRDKAEQGGAPGQGGLAATSAAEDGLAIQEVRITGAALLDYFA